MPLPAYLTQQPDINPIEAVSRRIQRLGFDVSLARRGRTIMLSGVESDDLGHDTARKAIKIACDHADINKLTIEAVIPAIQCNVVTDYQSLGFRIVLETDEEHEQGPHCLLRRAAA